MRPGDGGRERSVYLSEANELEVTIVGRHGGDMTTNDDDAIFLLRYDGTSHDDVITGARCRACERSQSGK